MSAHKTPYRLHVGTEPAYDVQIGLSLREAAVAAASCLPAGGQVRLVSDEQVYALYGEPVKIAWKPVAIRWPLTWSPPAKAVSPSRPGKT